MTEPQDIPIEVCPKCGYDLRGTDLPERCPECGRALDEKLIERVNKRRSTARWPTPTALAACAALPILSIIAALYASPVDPLWDALYLFSMLWIGMLSGVAATTIITRSIADPSRRALVRNAWLPLCMQFMCVPMAGLFLGMFALGLASLDDIPPVIEWDLAIVSSGAVSLVGLPAGIGLGTYLVLRTGGPTRAIALAEHRVTRRLTLTVTSICGLSLLYGVACALTIIGPIMLA